MPQTHATRKCPCLAWLIASILAAGCGKAEPKPLILFAAASTREPVEELAARFQARGGPAFTLNFGPTSTLAKQIEQGASADLFLAADTDWPGYLADKGLVARLRPLLSNRLVVVTPPQSELKVRSLEDLAGAAVHRLALAGAEVPAGRYARAALRHAGVWERVQQRVLDAADVRATLACVIRGEAEAGIVYATDAQGNRAVKVALDIDPASHSPIRYPLVLLRQASGTPEARHFFDYLSTAEASAVFQQAGFLTSEPAAVVPDTGDALPPIDRTHASVLGLTAEDWQTVWFSVRVASAAVLLSLPFGVALGWLLARKSFAGKTAVEALVTLPLVLPPVVTGYLLLVLLGKQGWLGGWLYASLGIEVALTWKAAVIAVAIMGFPLLVRAIRLAFQGTDPRLFQVARSLGASPFDAFWTVSLPLARHGVIAGMVLAFARGLGEFGATLMVAGNQAQTRTLALQVYALSNLPGEEYERRMWALVGVSIALACLALAGSEYLERRGHRGECA